MGLPAELRNTMDEWVPRLNREFCRGLAHEHLKQAPDWIHQAFLLVAERYPKGLVYEGISSVSPKECYVESTRRSGSDRTFDIAPTDSDMFMVRHSFNGVPLTPRYVSVPFADVGGRLTISAARLYIKPVLCDQVISVNDSSIFARLNKIKLTFMRRLHFYQSNYQENSPREAAQVFWSHIFNSNTNRAKTSESSPKTPLAAYLFAKYGVTETFRRFAGCDVVVGVDAHRRQALLEHNQDLAESLKVISEELYPVKDWVICSTTGMKVRRRKSKDIAGLMIAIPREKYTRMVRSLVVSFYYVLDHFPDYQAQYYFDDTQTWRLFIGYILRGDEKTLNMLMAEMDLHVNSIDAYLDPFVAASLKKLGHECSDFYDFLAKVMQNYEQWVLEKDQKGTSPIGKVFTVLPYALYDVTACINNLGFALGSPETIHTHKAIDQIFAENLRHTTIFDMVRGDHGEVDSADTPGDCYALTLTKEICPQALSSGRKRKPTAGGYDAKVHATWPFTYQLVCTSKACPPGNNRANHTLEFDKDYVVVEPNDKKQLIAWTHYAMNTP